MTRAELEAEFWRGGLTDILNGRRHDGMRKLLDAAGSYAGDQVAEALAAAGRRTSLKEVTRPRSRPPAAIHMRLLLGSEPAGPACGQHRGELELTDDMGRVTCLKCQHSRPWKEAVG